MLKLPNFNTSRGLLVKFLVFEKDRNIGIQANYPSNEIPTLKDKEEVEQYINNVCKEQFNNVTTVAGLHIEGSKEKSLEDIYRFLETGNSPIKTKDIK
jgi:hypothetical protein